jgi:hypothetical protein
MTMVRPLGGGGKFPGTHDIGDAAATAASNIRRSSSRCSIVKSNPPKRLIG